MRSIAPGRTPTVIAWRLLLIGLALGGVLGCPPPETVTPRTPGVIEDVPDVAFEEPETTPSEVVETEDETELPLDADCQDECDGRLCGPDPCSGASCGGCPAGMACTAEGTCAGGVCEASDPGCCSADGVSLTHCVNGELTQIKCGHCGWDPQAKAYSCTGSLYASGLQSAPRICGCVPACDGKQCGPDGCGGLCGTCSEATTCFSTGDCADELVGAGESCWSAIDVPTDPLASPAGMVFEGVLAGHGNDLDAWSAGCGFEKLPSTTTYGPDLVFRLTPATSGEYAVTLEANDFDGVLYVLDSEAGNPEAC